MNEVPTEVGSRRRCRELNSIIHGQGIRMHQARRGVPVLGLVLAFVMSASSQLFGQGTVVQSPEEAAGNGRQAMRACHADMKMLCADVAKGVGGKMNCLKANQAKLSTGCQSAIQSVIHRQNAIGAGRLKLVCQADIAARCPGLGEGKGGVGKCLRQYTPVLSQPCKAAVDAAQAKRVLRRQANLICQSDALNLCPQLSGRDLVACLQQKQMTASASCQQALSALPLSKAKPLPQP